MLQSRLVTHHHGISLHTLVLGQDTSLLQNANTVGDNFRLNALRSRWELYRLHPFSGIGFGVVQVGGDVRNGFLRVLVEVCYAFVELGKQILETSIKRLALLCKCSRSDDFPATPRGVNFSYAADLARVVELLGRKVLPHEEVGLTGVDGVAQVRKCV